jgi:hypothetical protein
MDMACRHGLLERRVRKQNGKNGKSWMPALAVKTRLGPLGCLALLLTLTFLPLVHHWHLNGMKKSNAFHTARNEHKIGLCLSEPDSDKQQSPHHNAATCPICQVASMCRYFSTSTLSLSPVLALPVQWFCESDFLSLVADSNILTSVPRAPPTSL